MTTDRPYRTRRNLEQVIVDFRKNTGSQFESEVIVALCRALLKEIKGETKTRPLIKMLGKGYIDAVKIIPLLTELISELEPARVFCRRWPGVKSFDSDDRFCLLRLDTKARSCRFRSSDQAQPPRSRCERFPAR